jgi:GDPmannose 4,6-dehydratase
VKTALILGITGQDGANLAHLLLGKGNRVVGSSRDAQIGVVPVQWTGC